MEVVTLKNDGRCKWLENKVMHGIFPKMIEHSLRPGAKKMYLIVEWISNDNGRVGVDLKWLKTLGLDVVSSYRDLPNDNNFIVVNTGYDSIVYEEKILKARGVEIVDLPCPFIRKIRTILEKSDGTFQYVLLCEPNHIIIKNYSSIFPKDLILVQMANYKEKIIREQNGKQLALLPYVTFLPSHINEIYDFICQSFPERQSMKYITSCMWISSKASPIVEIESLSEELLEGITDALLIATSGSVNKSLVSLIETIEKKNLQVVMVSSLKEFIAYEKQHRCEKILLVKSPIPNKAENPIIAYIERGYIPALLVVIKDSTLIRLMFLKCYRALVYTRNHINYLFTHKKNMGITWTS